MTSLGMLCNVLDNDGNQEDPVDTLIKGLNSGKITYQNILRIPGMGPIFIQDLRWFLGNKLHSTLQVEDEILNTNFIELLINKGLEMPSTRLINVLAGKYTPGESKNPLKTIREIISLNMGAFLRRRGAGTKTLHELEWYLKEIHPCLRLRTN